MSLVDLLGNISKSVKDTREMGRKFGIVEQTRQSAKKGAPAFADDIYSGMSDKSDGQSIIPQNVMLSQGYMS